MAALAVKWLIAFGFSICWMYAYLKPRLLPRSCGLLRFFILFFLFPRQFSDFFAI